VSPLSQLLDVQILDLEIDRLKVRREEMPEREALKQSRARGGALDEIHVAMLEAREALGRAEREISGEVAALAARANEVEQTLYSGSISAPKELESLQEEIRLLREKQSGLEEREMELLEEMDRAENEINENRTARDQTEDEAKGLEATIHDAEGEIDAELARLAEQALEKRASIPAEILDAYDGRRSRPRLAGRAAAPLAEGSCGGCHMQLPRLDYDRMKAEPEDALLLCVHCGRILVR
jgi:predicted  nucleic acid-binding Zn-ribbon protein